MNVRYRVELSQVERTELKTLLSGGNMRPASSSGHRFYWRRWRRAGDEEIARSLGVGGSTVYRTKRRFVESNLERR